MVIEKFRKELQFLELKEGDGISILYRTGASQRVAWGDFVGVTNTYPCRLGFLDCDRARTSRSICYRNIVKIERYDWHTAAPYKFQPVEKNIETDSVKPCE